MTNLYTDVPTYSNEEKNEFNVVIDIPKGSNNKYEYDEKGGYFHLDRALYTPTVYPFEYGFVPQTHAGDGDAIDVALLLTFPVFSGCVIKCRAIGCIKASDQDGEDEKVIAVPISKVDPRWDEVQSYTDLPKHFQEELSIFFKEYKKLEKEKYDKVVIKGFGTKEEAVEMIKTARATFMQHHS